MLGLSLSLVSPRTGSFDPLSLSPSLLLDASEAGSLYNATSGGSLVADGGSVYRWEDLSGRGWHLSEPTNTPIYTSATPRLRFDGTNDKLATRSFTATDLPDASGGDTGKGFTSTGLARAADGTWWAANDGRNIEGDVTFEPSLVHLSADFSTKLGEIDLVSLYGLTDSVQGVAVDPSDGSLWFVDYGGQRIEHCTAAGVDLADGFSVSAVGVPNGLAFDPDTSGFVVLFANSEVRRYNQAGAVTATLTDFPTIYGDQLTIRDGVIYATEGANGASGSIYAYVGASWIKIGVLHGADAVEGVWIAEDLSEIVVLNDAYFHGGSPALNRALRYPAVASNAVGEIHFVGRLTGAPAQTCTLAVLGSPAGIPGLGIYVPSGSTTTMRVISNTGTGATNQASVDTTVLSMTSYSYWRVRVDWSAKTLSIWRDGVAVASGVSLATLGSNISLLTTATVGGSALDASNRASPFDCVWLLMCQPLNNTQAAGLLNFVRGKFPSILP